MPAEDGSIPGLQVGVATIRRRELLIGVGASVLPGRQATAQAASGRNVAIVIGVDKPGNLPILNAAASGAHEMATWLAAQGYEVVKPFTDEAGPVRASDVFDAVSAVIDKGIYSRLVIYFAGHGCIDRDSEFWLLSGAPRNSNEAINLIGSAHLARLSGLGNVVFISDACRSPSGDLAMSNVSGYNIFPNTGLVRPKATFVDQFLATQLGSVASEVSTDQRAHLFSGLYTRSFLSAFADTPTDYVRTVEGSEVVLNRDLQRYLESDLPKRALALRLKQAPDVQITSPDATYLGRVIRTGPARTEAVAQPPLTSQRLSMNAVRSALAGTRLKLDGPSHQLARANGYSETEDDVLKSASAADTFDAPTGFVVVGTGVVRVAATLGARATISRASAGGNATFVTVQDADAKDASILIEFDDGGGTVVAALRNFVGTVTVADGGVISLSYTPSAGSTRGLPDKESRGRLEQLRASIAAAARLRTFRVEGAEQAERLGKAIRVMKGIDPTLGLYAVYAFEQASRFEDMRSVAELMRSDLGQILFDVAMIGGRGPVKTVEPGGIVTPFCPLLTQGWNYLSATNASIPKPAVAASNFLRPALWTTFDSKGVATLLDGSIFEARSP
ncbi:caspase family protein [Methylobacterium sp.]|uniref:caspase family protein n=1 Tax=Methylobacterium sp. TaxID=409 RepID=UPI000C47B41E|nr:caspase family protein [Methylobacterium sp.]MBP33144.1 hypothetical protein [Methylobacterium sp.]